MKVPILERADEPMLETGEIVQCANCQTDLLQAQRPLYRGEIIDAGMFKQMTNDLGEWLANGALCICPVCSTAWCLDGALYVKGRRWVV